MPAQKTPPSAREAGCLRGRAGATVKNVVSNFLKCAAARSLVCDCVLVARPKSIINKPGITVITDGEVRIASFAKSEYGQLKGVSPRTI
jgi:hypothetical protein